jgi:simple sugar transport system ATP-binding protein
MVHQHFMLVPPFTVTENIVLGEETHTAGVIQMDEPSRRIRQLMQDNGLTMDLGARVEDLPVGMQQRVEILKVLYRGAEILVFDEPTAVLTPQEADELFNTFKEMKVQGRGIIFISHKLDEVLAIADRITVIRRGKIIETLPGEGATKAQIAELMVGKPVLLRVENPESKPERPVLEIRSLVLENEHGTKVLDEIDLTVFGGEIYGIAGVEGNGQSELVSSIAERIPPASGDILLDGQSIIGLDVRKRREAGISHIPEDRHRFGLLLPYPLDVNLVLGRHHKAPFVNRVQIINKAGIREFARDVIGRFDIRAPSESIPANTLSGGNQQKVIIARELSAEPRLLLASQPTRGVDIGATEFIYQQLVKAKTEGRAVLLISADLDEILSLSDRIGVMYKGRIIKEFSRSEAKKEEVGFYMMGEGGDG